jgi:hypothetical protein
MKNNKIIGILLTLTVLTMFLALDVKASGEGTLTCGYFGNTPTDGITLSSRPEDATAGETYSTNDAYDITFTIQSRTNGNNTYASYLYWDNVLYTASPTINMRNATFNHNETGVANLTIYISNETDYTHSYYTVFAIRNATNVMNITGGTCAGGLCNVTCATREVTLRYRTALNPICGDGKCNDGEVNTCPYDCGVQAVESADILTRLQNKDPKILIPLVALILFGIAYAGMKKK